MIGQSNCTKSNSVNSSECIDMWVKNILEVLVALSVDTKTKITSSLDSLKVDTLEKFIALK